MIGKGIWVSIDRKTKGTDNQGKKRSERFEHLQEPIRLILGTSDKLIVWMEMADQICMIIEHARPTSTIFKR